MSEPARLVVEPLETDLDANAARRLTDQIRMVTEAMWQSVVKAWEGRVWLALGYGSWDEYCSQEFGTSRIALPREERDGVVMSLHTMGMSTRAIASATGVSKGSVSASISRAGTHGTDEAGGEVGVSGAQNWAADTPTPQARAAGEDGKQYPSRRASKADVFARQARVAVLKRQGLTQVQMAQSLGVAQATISEDGTVPA